MLNEMVRAPFSKDMRLSKEVGQVGDQTALRGEGVSQEGQGVHSDNCHGFFTIFDKILTVGESARDEERAGQPHPYPVDFLEGERGECEKFHGSRLRRGIPTLVGVLQEVHEDRWRPV
jgi:hypothetical protein